MANFINACNRGRKTKLTREFLDRMEALILKGVPRSRACVLAGVSYGALLEWLAKGRADEARGRTSNFTECLRVIEEAESKLIEHAIGTITEFISEGQSQTIQMNAAKFVLTSRFSGDFGNKTELTGPNGGPILVSPAAPASPVLTDSQLSSMTPEQLEVAMRALAVEPVEADDDVEDEDEE